jgi:hypothetical protein
MNESGIYKKKKKKKKLYVAQSGKGREKKG